MIPEDLGEALMIAAERGRPDALVAYLRSRLLTSEEQPVLAEWLEANYRPPRKKRGAARFGEQAAGALLLAAREKLKALKPPRTYISDDEHKLLVTWAIDKAAKELGIAADTLSRARVKVDFRNQRIDESLADRILMRPEDIPLEDILSQKKK